MHENVKNYNKLCMLSKEGIFVNVVKSRTSEILAKKFFSTMEVYPSVEHHIVKEYFQRFWGSQSAYMSDKVKLELEVSKLHYMKKVHDVWLKIKTFLNILMQNRKSLNCFLC